jgi:hypothetical protein
MEMINDNKIKSFRDLNIWIDAILTPNHQSLTPEE